MTATITRTNSGGSSGTKWTRSLWVKRGALGATQTLCAAGSYLTFVSTDYLEVLDSAGVGMLVTNRKFRDPSAWYHFVLTYDSTAGSSDRLILYVNGVRETSFSTNNQPALNQVDTATNNGQVQYIGTRTGSNYYFLGEMSHVHFTDGYAYPASTFGETDATDGMWKINTSPTVTYGTNGFFLKMEDSTNLDLDSGTNGFTNFVTSGTGTSTKDNPSNNFSTLNPLDNFYFNGTFSNGNNTTLSHTTTYAMITSTLAASSGKYYVEAKLSGGHAQAKFGITCRPARATSEVMTFSGSSQYTGSDGNLQLDGSVTAGWGSTWGIGDIVACALDLDNNRIYFSVNGVWQSSGNPSAGTGYETIISAASTTTGVYLFSWNDNHTSIASTMQYNFGNGYFGTTAITSAGTNASGNGTFEYDVPTGFTALSTKGLNT